MYDVLNKIAVDSTLGHARSYEVDLATQHLTHCKPGDLLLTDRNYPSFRWLASVEKQGCFFVSRCSSKSFTTAREMLKGKGEDSQTITLNVHHSKRKEIQKHKLSESITVRFVRVILSTGEIEVLATNLLDESSYPTEEFKEIYYLRWGIETFYGTLKGRCNLENFSGKSVESVYQDFYAMIYLSGLESILVGDTNIQLQEKKVEHKQQVNHAISFNAIKNCAFEILGSEEREDDILKKLEMLFLTNTVSVRKNRKVPREKRSARHILNYLRRFKKSVF